MTKPKTTAEDAAEIEFSVEPPADWPEAIKFTDVFERGAAFQEYVCAENNHEAELAKPLP